MKSILINAQTEELSEINLNKPSVLEQTYKAIGNDCEIVQTACYLTDTEVIVVDEEGYFKENLKGFYIENVGFFYGNGVVWNCDENGESTDCETSIEDLKSKITWVDETTSQHIRLRILENPMFTFHILDENSKK
jgi:hypothetical protein